jgi:hypothetical protein
VKFSSAAVAAALFLVSPLVRGEDGWYLAYDLGQAKASQPVLFSANVFSYTSGGSGYSGGFAGPVSHDQTDTAHRFEAGYWFNSYVGLALDMTDLGEHMTHAQFTSVQGPVSCGLPCDNSYEGSPRLTTDGKGLAITGRYPLSHGFSLVAHLGEFWSHVVYDSGINATPGAFGNANLPQNFHSDDNKVVSTYGLGARWEFVEHWALRVDWDDYQDLTGGGTTFDVRMTSLGIEYRF